MEEKDTGFWERIRTGFLQLGSDADGCLIALWDSHPEPGRWDRSYSKGVFRPDIGKRFEWNAQTAAARLGGQTPGDAAVAYWLDRIKMEAPQSHVRTILGGDGAATVQIADICHLSAEYCRKCEGDEIRLLSSAVAGERGTPQSAGAEVVEPTVRAPVFIYEYPDDLPDIGQIAIEKARADADRHLESKRVRSYGEHRAARRDWFWTVVSAAAAEIARAGAELQWGANRRRRMLHDFGLKAAEAAKIAGANGQFYYFRICKSEEWRALDGVLLGAVESETAEMSFDPRVEQVGTVEPQPAIPSEVSYPPAERRFRRSGDAWLVTFDGKPVHIKNSKGMGYIFELLQSPRQERHSFQLLAAAAGEDDTIHLGSAGEILDEKAIQQNRDRIEDIETRLSQAERDCDQAQKEALMEEKERVEDEIQSALGRGGRQRDARDDAERARKSVLAAISRALASIREHHPAAADHLEKHILCGIFNSYDPDEVAWDF